MSDNTITFVWESTLGDQKTNIIGYILELGDDGGDNFKVCCEFVNLIPTKYKPSFAVHFSCFECSKDAVAISAFCHLIDSDDYVFLLVMQNSSVCISHNAVLDIRPHHCWKMIFLFSHKLVEIANSHFVNVNCNVNINLV